MTVDTTTGLTPETREASALVDHWSTDDKRFFANFMCGYDPDAVTAFEKTRRRFAAQAAAEHTTAA